MNHHVEDHEYVDAFRSSFEDGTEAIVGHYFLLPLDGADPVYRERTYCYELYHQIKAHWSKALARSPFELGGEVDKAGHPRFQHPALKGKKPDLLVHVPGNMGSNLVAVEVKSVFAARGDIEDDLQKLTAFCRLAGYRRAFYLVFGYEAEEVARVQRISRELSLGNEGIVLAEIDLYWHPAPATRARKLPW
jgi:hypothetical protein